MTETGYEIDEPPEEFRDEIAMAMHEVLRPCDFRQLRQLLLEDGRAGVERAADKLFRDDLQDRDAYLQAFTDALVQELDG